MIFALTLAGLLISASAATKSLEEGDVPMGRYLLFVTVCFAVVLGVTLG